MDRRLESHLGFEGGFFVEAGANDGYQQSNTYFLERALGWRGVLVEPAPPLWREACRERPNSKVFRAALVSDCDDGGEVRLLYGGLMTIVAGVHASTEADRAWAASAHAVAQQGLDEFLAPGRTLSSILEEARAPAVIDFLSLDVEGYEAQALAGLDLDRHAPRFVLVETQAVAERRAAIERVLGDRYVAIEHLSPLDVLYARADQPAARVSRAGGGADTGAGSR